jgi:hypothetical protein
MATNERKLSRIGEKTANVGPVSFWGPEIPLYKLHECDYLFQFDFVIEAFASMSGANGRYVHIKGHMATGVGPNGETGDIAISTGAKSILARLDALDPNEDFPILARFIKGGKAPNQWYDME